MAAVRLERALFVIGAQDSGKSTQLRSMFRDVRFGTNSVIPPRRMKPPEIITLDHYKKLYLRMTSPHEYDKDLVKFISKIRRKISDGSRWCLAAPLQYEASYDMPDCVATIDRVIQEFSPGRVRVLFLSPDRHEHWLGQDDLGQYIDELEQYDCSEWACIDATQEERNGLLLADFFDYSVEDV